MRSHECDELDDLTHLMCLIRTTDCQEPITNDLREKLCRFCTSQCKRLTEVDVLRLTSLRPCRNGEWIDQLLFKTFDPNSGEHLDPLTSCACMLAAQNHLSSSV